MAGKVLTDEDFKEGDHKPEDTSKPSPKPDEVIEGKVKEEAKEPEDKVEPSGKGEEESLSKPSEDAGPKYKHKTWEETEKARQELERGFTEKSMRLSQVEKKLAQLEKPAEKPVTIDDRIKILTKETLSKIKALPNDSPTRDEDAAYLWSKNADDVALLRYDEREKRSRDERDVVKKTYDSAVKEGIKTEAELRILGYEFAKTDSSLSTDERIRESIESTKNILSQIREGLVEKQERDKKEKDDLKVLGRGSSRREKSEEEKKGLGSMSDDLAKIAEQRRIKKDDLRY